MSAIGRTNETHRTDLRNAHETVAPKNHKPEQQITLEHTMHINSTRARAALHALATLALVFASVGANAVDAAQGIEQALNAALQDKRGITLYVAGQTIGGAVTRVEPGQWVELKNQTSSKIIVRLDRIDGIAAP